MRVDLSSIEREPDYRGSVQDLFRQTVAGKECLICRTSESGSVFDVGTFFSVPGSDVTRTAVRHEVYSRLMDPDAWQALEASVLDRCLGIGEYRRLVESHPIFDAILERGVRTHHLGIIDPDTGKVISTGFPMSPSALVLVEEYPIFRPVRFSLLGRPAWDYHAYLQSGTKITALEHVFRLGCPGGSSLLTRYQERLATEGRTAAIDFLRSLGIPNEPAPWREFDHMTYDCAAKYESHDRHLDWQETVHLYGLNANRIVEAFVALSLCTVLVYAFFNARGLDLWDIKWELAAADGSLVVVDTIDPDSIRLTGQIAKHDRAFLIHFNKQAVRDYFRILHTDWYEALNESKRVSMSDPKGRGFTQIYREGVAAGLYPGLPSLDPEFQAIQARKYELVAGMTRQGERFEPTPDDISATIEQEIAFYDKRGSLDILASYNAVPIST